MKITKFKDSHAMVSQWYILSTCTVASSFTSGIPLLKGPPQNKTAYEIQNFGIFGVDFRF